jgi:2-oxoisovalerate dehydrogenase E1 component alpha subunit
VERYLPHTSDDDDSRYRDPKEIEAARERDPLRILNGQLKTLGYLTTDDDEEIRQAATREVDEATEFVESAPYPGTEGYFAHVYAGPGGAPSP